MSSLYDARKAACALLTITFAGLAAGCVREVSVFERTPGSDADTPLDAGDLTDASSPTADAGDAESPDGGTPTPGASIAAFEHTCASLRGSLYCWGDNEYAQLGLGDREPRAVPQRVSPHRDFVQVCAGEAHSCGLRSTGELLCWGENLNGELGLGDTVARETPTAIDDMRFSRVVCGGSTTCALDLTGALFCWGDNFEGQLGQDDAFQSPNLRRPAAVSPALSFRDVSLGQGHACAITRQGVLYCWGRNTTGQLGLMEGAPEQVRRPTPVDAARRFQNVSAGQSHTCAVAREGSLLCWGTDQMGTLGQGLPSGARVTQPTPVGNEQIYSSVRASWFHTCALRTDGTLYCWGRNVEGQLGLGDQNDRNTPVRVGLGVDWNEVALGRFHTCGALLDDVFCWGENDARNQLGLGENTGRRDEPSLIAKPDP